ncbi:MAG TPA: ATP-binding protein [Polyangiaceae bacterium]|nr:ATP-binding protein [Polyangiaceae bacterium]
MIRLSVPGTLKYRGLVLRVVASSCKLLRSETHGLQEASHESAHDSWAEEFDAQVVSAIGEAFNNIAIHGYRGALVGDVQIEIGPVPDGIELCMMDHGVTFDLSLAEPTRPSSEPDQLPESGMGLYIIRSFMDSVAYRAGGPEQPNVLRLTKRYSSVASGLPSGASDPARVSEPRSETAQGTRSGK